MSSADLQDRVRTALRGSWMALVVMLVATGLQYWVAVLLARWLSPTDYGDFEVAMTMLGLLWLAALLGSEKSIFRFLPLHVDRGDWGPFHGFLRFHGWIAACVALGIAVVGTVLAILPGPTLTRPRLDATAYHPTLLALWLLPLFTSINLIDKVPRLFNRILESLLPFRILLPVLVLGSLYALRASGWIITDWLAVGIVGLAAAGVLVVQWVIHLRLPIGRGELVYQPWLWLSTSVPIMLTGVLILALTQVDLLMVEWLGREGDVGVFGLAARTSMFIFIITQSINAVMAPFIARAAAGDDHEERRVVLRLAASLVFWPGAALVAVMAVFGGTILGLIGPAYTGAWAALVVLAVGHLLEGTIGFSKQYLIYADNKRIVLAWLSAALVLDIVLNAILIPVAGVTGAAIATNVAMVTSAVGMAIVTWRRYRISPIPAFRRRGG